NFAQKEKCANYAIFLTMGYDPEQFNNTLLPVILGHFPASTSTKTLLHFTQEIQSGKFCRYDYGREKNFLIYNSVEPPDYNVTSITVPIALFYSDGDLMFASVGVYSLDKRGLSGICFYLEKFGNSHRILLRLREFFQKLCL
ncbi:lipase 3, partial [Lasius niger]